MNNTNNQINISGIAQILFTTFKWLSICALVVSIVGLGMSILDNYPLWINSTKSTGIIVGYKAVHIPGRSMSSSSSNSFETRLPILEFIDYNGRSVKFDSKYGHNSEQKGAVVPIIYSNIDPKNAIVDLGIFHNWLSTYIWLFIMFGSLLGIKRFSCKPGL